MRPPCRAPLNQGCFTFQDLQCLLEPSDLCCSLLRSGAVGFGFGDTLALNLGQVLLYCVQLVLHAGTVGAQFARSLVQLRTLLLFVFRILLLGSFSISFSLVHFSCSATAASSSEVISARFLEKSASATSKRLMMPLAAPSAAACAFPSLP